MIKYLGAIWKQRPHQQKIVLKLDVTLLKLRELPNYIPDLFLYTTDNEKHQRLDSAVDSLREKYGRQSVFLGSVQDGKESAPMRISFNHIPDLNLENDQ